MIITIFVLVSALIGFISYYAGRQDGRSIPRPLEIEQLWQSYKADNGEIHTVPFYDNMTHVISDTCLCTPDTEYKESIEGWVITHHNAKERNS